GGERDDAPARTAAISRFHADDAAQTGGLADRAAGIGAGGAERETGRDRGGRAARGAARNQGTVVAATPPRILDRAVARGGIARSHGEFVETGLAEHDRAGIPEFLRHGG